NEVFDAIAYEKTASVLRMTESFVGPDLFRQGISAYLRKFSFANATGEDFWNEMTRVTRKPIDRIMKPYIEQPGVPVVSITSRCAGGATELVLQQERFVGVPGATAPDSPLWTTPACFKTSGGTTPACELLERREQKASLQSCTQNLFANAN